MSVSGEDKKVVDLDKTKDVKKYDEHNCGDVNDVSTNYLPYFTDMQATYFFQDKYHEGKAECRHMLCKQSGYYACGKHLCKLRFCSDHYAHDHCLCRYPECKQLATTMSRVRNVECCETHFNVWDTVWVQVYRCQTCKKQITKERSIIGHCVSCQACGTTSDTKV